MSTARLNASMVAGACRACLQARDERIAAKREKIIEAHTGHKKWWWSRPMTREQAEEFCSEEIYWTELRGSRWAHDIKELLALATMAEKCDATVSVSAELAMCIEPYFGE